jgi:hypothetical protein
MLDRATTDAIIAAERTLFDPAIRTDREALEQWLDPDFAEIGQSGRFWTREAVCEDLLSTDQGEYQAAELSEPRVLQLSDDVYLLTYVVQVGARRSRRSSIWRKRDGQLRIVFNQGTPVDR